MEQHITKQPSNESLPSSINLIGETMVPKELFKYWSYNSLKELLNKKELVFVHPGLWKDPFEKIYLTTDYIALGFKQTKIYCMSFIVGVENEDTEWKMYSDNDKKTIRCRINVRPLCEIISAFAEKNDLLVYMGNVNYELTRDKIQSLYLLKGKDHDHYFKEFSLGKYLQLMALKPKNHEYENELRIFLVPKQENKYFKDILKIPIHEDQYSLLFSNFTIQPFEIKQSHLPNQEKLDKGFYDFVKSSMAENLSSLYPNVPIDNYEQFKKCKPVKRISLKTGKTRK